MNHELAQEPAAKLRGGLLLLLWLPWAQQWAAMARFLPCGFVDCQKAARLAPLQCPAEREGERGFVGNCDKKQERLGPIP